MNIGITGTRKGLSLEQERYAFRDIPWSSVHEIHSGDCIGVDEQLHNIAVSVSIKSIGHPPTKNDYRAFCNFDEEKSCKGYFQRNRNIVKCADIVYGFPLTEVSGRGGTWYTISYAINKGKKVIVITPSGKIKTYN